ncbi:MAG: PPC domain-containing DNA-binding protein [candidate division WOR-3 bacterium]
MDILKVKNGYVLKLEVNEDIIAELKDFTKQKKIKGAFLFGLGAGKEITLGYYDPIKKNYHKRFFPEDYEFASIIGNIAYLDEEPILHIHCTISPNNFNTYSGHLFSAKVAATVELMVMPLDKRLLRKPDVKTALNLLSFNHYKTGKKKT